MIATRPNRAIHTISRCVVMIATRPNRAIHTISRCVVIIATRPNRAIHTISRCVVMIAERIIEIAGPSCQIAERIIEIAGPSCQMSRANRRPTLPNAPSTHRKKLRPARPQHLPLPTPAPLPIPHAKKDPWTAGRRARADVLERAVEGRLAETREERLLVAEVEELVFPVLDEHRAPPHLLVRDERERRRAAPDLRGRIGRNRSQVRRLRTRRRRRVGAHVARQRVVPA